MKDSERDYTWWLVGGAGDPDLEHLAEAVGSSDWAVFAGRDDDPDAPPVVALKLANSADGRKICTAMIVGFNEGYPIVVRGHGGFNAPPAEVTSRALRQIPVAELIGRAVNSEKAPPHHAAVRELVLGRLPSTESPKRAPGPKGHPDEHFEMVAAMYREALKAAPRRPMIWLADRLNADRTTVARWVQRARDKGFLGESQPGKAGETRSERNGS